MAQLPPPPPPPGEVAGQRRPEGARRPPAEIGDKVENLGKPRQLNFAGWNSREEKGESWGETESERGREGAREKGGDHSVIPWEGIVCVQADRVERSAHIWGLGWSPRKGLIITILLLTIIMLESSSSD